MDDKEERVRLNIKVSKEVQEYFREEADRYNVPYTTYISLILTQMYENDNPRNI